MAVTDRSLAHGATEIDFRTEPSRWRHWRLAVDGAVATLTMDVDEAGGLFEGYPLKLNSYDLGVDIELADAAQRLRFEHPEVRVVVLRSGKERVFCAGANIRMLAGATHTHKVGFCKFTNETRNAIEDASAFSGQAWLAVVNGTAAGGGYELALACDHILLVDDGSAAVSLPEVPLLAVLPGTGGLTRLTDKRKVRRDLADVFCTTEEGVRGRRAVAWKLVDEIAPTSRLDDAVTARALAMAAATGRTAAGPGIALTPIVRRRTAGSLAYSSLTVAIDRRARTATIVLAGPDAPPPADIAGVVKEGAGFWPLRLARELDDAILHLRMNEPEIGILVFRSEGEPEAVLAFDALLAANIDHWLANEIVLLWKRVLKRLDVTARTLVALVEPGSCFAGTLAEIALAADRSFMLIGEREGDGRPPPVLTLGALNFGAFPMVHGPTRVANRHYGDEAAVERAQAALGTALAAEAAEELGLVTTAMDDIDWDDEVRLFLEQRAAFSPDALTGLEANLRFPGPETMESKIFARLTAWQNWIFQRANAVGPEGALGRYGTGQKPAFDFERV
jgi:benzoyl-CoA-dihydrodiol lyase